MTRHTLSNWKTQGNINSVLLYDAEVWTLTKTLMKRLGAFEMCLYRRILRISYTEHIINVEVLRRIGKETETSFTIKKRKIEYVYHLMMHYKYHLLQLIIQRKMKSKRGSRSRRHSAKFTPIVWFAMGPIIQKCRKQN